MVLKGGKALGPALLSEDRRTRSRGSRKRRGVFIRRACVDIRRGVCVSEDVKTRWRVVRRNPEGRCSGVSRRNGPVWTHLRISGPLVLCITLTSKTTPTALLRRWERSTDELPVPAHLHTLRQHVFFCRTSSGARLCWELEERHGRNGHASLRMARHSFSRVADCSVRAPCAPGLARGGANTSRPPDVPEEVPDEAEKGRGGVPPPPPSTPPSCPRHAPSPSRGGGGCLGSGDGGASEEPASQGCPVCPGRRRY